MRRVLDTKVFTARARDHDTKRAKLSIDVFGCLWRLTPFFGAILELVFHKDKDHDKSCAQADL